MWLANGGANINSLSFCNSNKVCNHASISDNLMIFAKKRRGFVGYLGFRL